MPFFCLTGLKGAVSRGGRRGWRVCGSWASPGSVTLWLHAVEVYPVKRQGDQALSSHQGQASSQDPIKGGDLKNKKKQNPFVNLTWTSSRKGQQFFSGRFQSSGNLVNCCMRILGNSGLKTKQVHLKENVAGLQPSCNLCLRLAFLNCYQSQVSISGLEH